MILNVYLCLLQNNKAKILIPHINKCFVWFIFYNKVLLIISLWVEENIEMQFPNLAIIVTHLFWKGCS